MKAFADSVRDENMLARRRQRVKEQVSAWALLAPFIIILVVFAVVPFAMGFVYVFLQYNPYNVGATQFIGLKNFTTLFDVEGVSMSQSFWESFGPVTVYAL